MVLSSEDQYSDRVVEDSEHKEEQEEENPIGSVEGGLCKAKLKERREFVELDNVMHWNVWSQLENIFLVQEQKKLALCTECCIARN